MNEDLIIQKVISLEEDMKVVKEKVSKLDLIDALLQGQDKMIRILERVDQERVFTNEKIRHLEMEVKQIKEYLHIT